METPKEILEILRQPTISESRKHRNFGRVSVVDSSGYKIARSRFVWEQVHGKIPEGMFIHHKNGIKDDDRIENLEMVTRLEHGQRHKELRRISCEKEK